MDQFSPPPQHDHFAEPPPHAHAANGAHSTFNGFLDPMPPMGEHEMAPPPHPEAHEPNPLVAAMAQEASLPAAQPSFPPPPPFAAPPQNQMFAPVRHVPAPPRQQHAHANGDSAPNGASNGAANGAKRRPGPDFSGLPPAMAESLAKLAGVPWPPRAEDDDRELEANAAGNVPPRREG
jgi:hypothetical protein